MKAVRMLSENTGTYVGSDGVVHFHAGHDEVVELPDELAEDLIRREQAVPNAEPEHRDVRRQRRRRAR